MLPGNFSNCSFEDLFPIKRDMFASGCMVLIIFTIEAANADTPMLYVPNEAPIRQKLYTFLLLLVVEMSIDPHKAFSILLNVAIALQTIRKEYFMPYAEI